MAGQREVLADDDPPGAVHLGARGVGQQLPELAGLHACRPHLALGGDGLGRAVLLLEGDAVGVDAGDEGVHAQLDAQFLQGLAGLGAQFLAEGRQRRRRPVH